MLSTEQSVCPGHFQKWPASGFDWSYTEGIRSYNMLVRFMQQWYSWPAGKALCRIINKYILRSGREQGWVAHSLAEGHWDRYTLKHNAKILLENQPSSATGLELLLKRQHEKSAHIIVYRSTIFNFKLAIATIKYGNSTLSFTFSTEIWLGIMRSHITSTGKQL